MTPEFHYRANGLALGGTLSQQPLKTQAASILPWIGGKGQAVVQSFSAADGAVTFECANTWVSGYKDDESGVYQTTVRVVIHELNLSHGLITVDAIDAILNSRHPVGDEPSIVPTVAISGLKIMGKAFPPRTHSVLLQNTRMSALRALVDHPLVDPEGQPIDFAPPSLERAAPGDQWRMTSLFECWQEGDPHSPAVGGAGGLSIPGGGSLFLGDLLISPESRRLTVLRAELEGDCPGTVVAGYLETNGHWYP
jgi:hypothetical protein